MKTCCLLLTILLTSLSVLSQDVCCPTFTLKADIEACKARPDSGSLHGAPYENKDSCELMACKHTEQRYAVYPMLPGYTYTWEITGGTSASNMSNPVQITWGNGTSGFIRVLITNADGSCRDTITKIVCLTDAPIAAFSTSATSVCLNSPLLFNSTSTGGNSYYWDFGDGHSATSPNPNHVYTTPGTYTVILSVAKIGGYGPQSENCGCRDTASAIITVKREEGIKIIPDCRQMLCAGDTASYCTTSDCSSYNWSVTGGHIIGAPNGKCIKIKWDGTYPAAVTLTGNCGGACGNTATLTVPVLFPSMPVQGPASICPSSISTYTLPTMPGTFYSWHLSGGGSFSGADSNTTSVNIDWGPTPGTYTISCHYYNPITKCSGNASLQIKILPPYKITGPLRFCVGSNFSYSANGAGNWSIAPGNGFTPSALPSGTTLSGTWNAPGAYTIAATPLTPANYCSYPGLLNVVVLDTPKLGGINGPVLICPSGAGVYSISSNMAAGMFSWSVMGGTINSTMGSHHDSVTITWNATGPYSVSVSQSVDGCSSGVRKLDVTPYPPPSISGPSSVCMDAAAAYIATGAAPMGSYNWTINNALGTITSGQGTASVTVQWHGSLSSPNSVAVLSVTTCGISTPINISIFNPPVLSITKTGTFCSSGGVTLAASVAGASYQWKLNGTPVGGNTQSINALAPGSYLVTVTTSNGCITTAYFNLPAESSFAATISAGAKLQWDCTENVSVPLTALPSGSYCYQWYNNNTAIPGATNQIYNATAPGFYYCVVSLCNTTCSSNSDTLEIIKWTCQTDPGNCENYSFTASQSGCNPITFTSSTAPAGAGPAHWYFGDNATATGATVTHTYAHIGTYTVQAIFGTAPYCRKDTLLNVEIPLAANFSYIINCNTVSFTNLSESVTPGYTISWTFTGGMPSGSNVPNPVVTYAASGTYTAVLTISKVINGVTCTSSFSEQFTISIPAVSIAVPSPLCALSDVPFTSIGNPGWQYQWNFGDGFISGLQSTVHAYANPGSFTTVLTATDNNGCAVNVSQSITVLPALVISIGNDQTICPGSTATLFASPANNSYTYQWYKGGVLVPGATNSSLITSEAGEYWVTVSNGTGCISTSNHSKVLFKSSPIADITGTVLACKTAAAVSFQLSNSSTETGATYGWSTLSGPGTLGFAPANAWSTMVTATQTGSYTIVLTVTKSGCTAKDTFCVTVVKGPAISVTSPAGSLCAGEVYQFSTTVTPAGTYFYRWTDGTTNPGFSTGLAGNYSVMVTNEYGCTATGFTSTIKKRPDLSLFPVGCDTLCLTDTLRLPLPLSSHNNWPFTSSSYTISWFDGATPVGSGFVLPLTNLQPGDHHLHAVVVFNNGCSDTTGVFDLYVKDCDLLPPCDNCPSLLQSPTFTFSNNIEAPQAPNTYGILQASATFTTLQPLKEIRLSLADLKLSWSDTSCVNCKIPMIERGCLFPATAGQTIGTLNWDNPGIVLPPAADANACPAEIVWKSETLLPPGTYTVPLQLSLPHAGKDSCKLLVEKICLHLSLIDDACRLCDTYICDTGDKDQDNCACNASSNWTSLYLLPADPTIPKPRTQILCGTTLTNYQANTPYILSGLYHCTGGCLAAKNAIVVRNKLGDIIYSRFAPVLNEPILFPEKGLYTVSLTATCGDKKCDCSFKIEIGDKPTIVTDPRFPKILDSLVTTILPPDFNGSVLIAQRDSILIERHISYKDIVTANTAFDLASVAKTFTGMAMLKLMEQGKLRLEDDLVKYLPSFPFKGITIKMLLSHRSGLDDYVRFMETSSWDKRKYLTNADLLNYIIANKSKVQLASPGTAFSYSNTNYALLALVIETVSGQSYPDYMAANFFRPLKMTNTYVFQQSDLATATKSYYKNGKAYELKYLDLVYGDKNIYSSARDMLKWDKALRAGQFLKRPTIDLAYAPVSKLEPYKSNYGLGWRLLLVPNGKTLVYHNGWWHGNRSVFIRMLDEEAVIIILSNNNFTTISNSRKLTDHFGQYQQTTKNLVNF